MFIFVIVRFVFVLDVILKIGKLGNLGWGVIYILMWKRGCCLKFGKKEYGG